jgi:hypothetical protein
MGDTCVLGVESSPVKHHGLVAAIIIRLGFLFLVLSSLGFVFLGNSLHVPPETLQTSSQRVTGDQVKPYVEEHFQNAPWFSLIESIETQENQIVIKTFIFPDNDGRRLADEIVDALRQQGIMDEMSVYGRNISYSLLTHRFSSSKMEK